MRFKHLLQTFLGCWILGLWAIQTSFAQGVTSASINGTVMNMASESLPGATVVAVHIPTGTRYATATRNDGQFNLPNVRTGGPYLITATFVGYAEQKEENIMLKLGETYDAVFILSDNAQILTEVVVRGTSNEVINGSRNGAATNITKEQIANLPTLSRSFQDFVRLTPQAATNSQSGATFLAGRNSRFNNIQIDGASNNDLFGLGNTGAPGGSAGTTPISLDAIEEFQVVVSPYDVRQGRFSGGGINAVTRSGTNKLSGSAFFFGRNQNMAGKSPEANALGQRTKLDNFSDYQAGFRVGGAIIPNKLFYFANAEVTRRVEPLVFKVGDAGQTGSDIVGFVTNPELNKIDSILQNRYGYDAGSYGDISKKTESNKFFVRFDYNPNDKHQITLRFNIVSAFQDEITRSQREVRFSNNGYKFTNLNYSGVLEVKSRFGNNISNNLIVGYSSIRDKRETLGGLFPSVTIGGYAGGGTVVAGAQRSSVYNTLDQNVLEITDNMNLFVGKHAITLGTNNEFFNFDNLFINDGYGRYDFPSYAEFVAGKSSNTNYRYRQNFALPNGKPSAKFGAAQLGLYAQDEYSVSKNLKITGGIRFDLPLFFNTPSYNSKVDSTFGAQYDGVSTNKLPKTNVLISPRVGFNWDVKNDKQTQVRGGLGLFSGRVPYVWISNQYGGTGVDIGSADLRGTSAPILKGSVPDSISNIITTAPRGSIAVTSRSFKMPQLLRGNLAVDRALPWGLVATLEAIYTKTINDVLPVDINLKQATGTLAGDGRPTFPSGNDLVTGNSNRFINGRNFNSVILLDNTSKGYQYSLTAQLQKKYANGFFATAAYTYGQSRDLYSGGSSTAASIWEFNQHVSSPNNLPLAYSQFDIRHRTMAAISYRKEYAKNFATTLSIFYNGQSGQPFSYVYTNDLNGDGGIANDLIFIPAKREDILLVPTGTTDNRTIEQQWQQLDAFINEDDYLSENRGKYAARNAARTPWVHRFDVRLTQDFFMMSGDTKHNFQLTLDIINAGNMISKDWGRDYFVTNQSYEVLNYRGLDAATGRPQFSFGSNAGAPTKPAQVNQIGYRWQAQVGLRYTF